MNHLNSHLQLKKWACKKYYIHLISLSLSFVEKQTKEVTTAESRITL